MLRFAALIATLLAPEEPLPDVAAPLSAQIGQCDPVDGEPLRWSQATRAEVRARVQRACREELHASPRLCAFYDAVVVRESSGRAGVRHTLGRNENGLGAFGLSLRWHADKWPGTDEDPAWCSPEASLVVAHALVWRAVTHYQARDLLDVQAIYAGRWYCRDDWPRDGVRSCRAAPDARTEASICHRLADRGGMCRAPISRADLGERVPLAARRAWAEQAAASYQAAAGS